MKVIIRPEVYAQIDYYVQNTDIEISGVGRIKKRDEGVLEVTKVYLLNQENGPASTDIDAEALAQLMFETREDAEEYGDLNFWWHSHVNMGVFWSGTDMDTIKQFGRNGYLLATVFNKKHEFRSAYLQGATDFLPEVFVDNIPTSVVYEASPDQLADWRDEIKEKTRRRTFKSKFPKGQPYGYQNPFWKEWEEQEQKSKTLLGQDKEIEEGFKHFPQEDDYIGLCQAYMTMEQESEWTTYMAELKGLDPMNISYEQLWKFYELWDGDFKSMSEHVINQISIKEYENGNNLPNSRR